MKTAVTCGVVLALAAGVASADVLIFKPDNLELSGPKVEVLREHERGVDVKVSHGRITIPWSRIKSITIDYENHLNNMKADQRDTARGLLGFVRVLVRHDMYQEAADACSLILDKENVAEDILYDVARLMKSDKQWTLAKKACEMLLRVNPARKDVLRWIDEISGHIKEPGGKAAVEPAREPGKEPAKQPVKEPGKQPAKEPAKQPDKQPVKPPEQHNPLDGLEAEDDWTVEQWGNDATATVIQQAQPGDDKVLSIAYHSTDKDKVAVRLGGTWDLSRRQALTFRVWNASKSSLSLTVAFNTMPGWKFFESRAKAIRPKKWITVTIDLTQKRFKSEESKWRNVSELKNRDNVKQIILMIYNTSKEGVIYVDNIRFVDKLAAP